MKYIEKYLVLMFFLLLQPVCSAGDYNPYFDIQVTGHWHGKSSGHKARIIDINIVEDSDYFTYSGTPLINQSKCVSEFSCDYLHTGRYGRFKIKGNEKNHDDIYVSGLWTLIVNKKKEFSLLLMTRYKSISDYFADSNSQNDVDRLHIYSKISIYYPSDGYIFQFSMQHPNDRCFTSYTSYNLNTDVSFLKKIVSTLYNAGASKRLFSCD